MSLYIESIRWEFGQYHLLDYHAERMARTVRAIFSSNQSFDLKKLLPDPANEYALQKCRILYNEKIHKIEWVLYRRKLSAGHQLVRGDLIDYTFKKEDRSQLDNLKQSVDQEMDIIIVKNQMITDAFYSNLVFFDGQKWITPENPLLEGIMRSFLLNNKVIQSGEITVENLSTFQVFKKINAMNPIETSPIYLVDKLKTLLSNF